MSMITTSFIFIVFIISHIISKLTSLEYDKIMHFKNYIIIVFINNNNDEG